MPLISALTAFSSGTTIQSAQVNQNFDTIRTTVNSYALFTDVARTVTANLTFTPGAGVGITVSTGGITVSAGGITVTGNSTITGTLGGITGLTVASGGISVQAGGVSVVAGGIAVTAGNLALAAGQGYSAQVDAGNSGAAKTIDWNSGNSQKLTLTANCTLTLSNPQAGAHYLLRIAQDATGSRTITWPAAVHWSGGTAPTLTTTASKVDLIALYYDGATYFGAMVGANYTA